MLLSMLVGQQQHVTGVCIALHCNRVLCMHRQPHGSVYTEETTVQLMCKCKLHGRDSCHAVQCNFDSNRLRCSEDVVVLLSWQDFTVSKLSRTRQSMQRQYHETAMCTTGSDTLMQIAM